MQMILTIGSATNLHAFATKSKTPRQDIRVLCTVFINISQR